MIGKNGIRQIFETASEIDQTLFCTDEQLRLLHSCHLPPLAFESKILFTNLACCKPSLFFNYPKPFTRSVDASDSKQYVIESLINLKESFRYKIDQGLGEGPVRLTISELIQRWQRDDEILRVTNIHTRKTDIVEFLDPNSMCPFNLLRNGNPYVESLEMLTLMVATTGSITDSHSDDADVNNHCIVGKKLWLYWDSLEGVEAGIEDNERQSVFGQARFDMGRFLRLESAGWCLVKEGDTLFLPGNYAHKVIALEKYIGVGGFFVSFPSLLQAFSRWLSRPDLYYYKEPLYRERKGVEIADEIETSLLQSVGALGAKIGNDQSQRDWWGMSHIAHALKNWPSVSRCADKKLKRNKTFRSLHKMLASFA
ncbi:MAG: hypothetical protein HKN34_02770 [Gammaproteobacteria bacterium]|nr:hypothetical protein [Gammaproteobacteria bacterium]